MAIELVTAPNSLPLTTADYQAQNALIDNAFLNYGSLIPFYSGNIKKGAVFNIGGLIYRATSDTAITGTTSNYVKITASGATATAAYVASLSGVAWNDAYNGYYSGSDLVIFDESLAVYNGVVTTPRTRWGAVTAINANLLEGQEGSFYQNASNLNAGTVPQARLSAASILALLLTVDGAGSGVDADTVDGQHISGMFINYGSQYGGGSMDSFTAPGRYYLQTGTWTGAPSGTGTGNGELLIFVGLQIFRSNTTGFRYIRNASGESWSRIWDESSDGSGSGLDADYLRGSLSVIPTTRTVLTGSGTWTCPTGVTRVKVKLVGGGGGGGGGQAGSQATGGGGGGGGQILEEVLSVTPGTGYTYSVGGGGAGGAANSAPGADGSSSTFSTLTAVGGSGGGAASSLNRNSMGGSGLGGSGGAGSSGFIQGFGTSAIGIGGVGGGVGGGIGGSYTSAGTTATSGTGGGGGGGGAYTTTSAAAGGNGAAGTIVIEY